jgi:hypothetical protein
LCGKRPYSFAREIESVLAAFNVDTNVASSSPASSAALASFHQKVVNSQITISELASEYRSFQRHRVVRTLPLLTCKLFLRRLLEDLQAGLATQILLAYELNDTVNLVADVLQDMKPYDQKTYLVMLCAELRRLSQHGIAKQICTATGHSPTAMEQLLNCHEASVHHDVFRALSKQLFRSSTLDGYTVLVLCKRMVASGKLQEASSLVSQSPMAHHAVRFLLKRLSSHDATSLFTKLVKDESADYDLPTWRIALDACDLQQVYHQLSPATDPAIRTMIADRAARSLATITISHNIALAIAAAGSSAETLGALVSQWMLSLPPTLTVNAHDSVLQQLIDVLLQGDPQHLSDFLIAFADSNAQQSTAALYAVLKVVDMTDYEIPFHVEHKLTRHMLNKSAEEAALYMSLRKTSRRAMQALVNHHLRQHRLQKEDGQYFATMLHLLLRMRVDPAAINDLYRLCILQLIQLRPPALALSLLNTFTPLGLTPDLKTSAAIVRRLAQSGYYDTVLRLLECSTPAPKPVLTKAAGVQRNIFARFILHTASREPKVSMRALQLMRQKGFTPSAFLLESMALRLARFQNLPGTRSPVTNAVLFHYLTRVMALATKLGYRTGASIGFATSLVRLVLLRQGLGASKARKSYTLRRAQHSIPQKDFEELMSILRKWRAWTRQTARGTPDGLSEQDARKRPRELRELLHKVESRRPRVFGIRKGRSLTPLS